MDGESTQGSYDERDVFFAGQIGEKFAFDLSRVASEFLYVNRYQQSQLLLARILSDVEGYVASRHGRIFFGLSTDEWPPYSEALERIARVMRASRRLWHGSVPTLWQRARSASEDPRQGVTVIDVFNPLALEGIFSAAEAASRLQSPPIVGLPGWGSRLAVRLRDFEHVRFVPELEAGRGVLSLFADQLRFVSIGRREPGPSQVEFTLHNKDEATGYQIRHFEEFRYSPVVFGRTLSSPVSGPLAPRLYKFEGRRDGRTRIDSGVYPVDSDHTEATLGDF